jgi:hypothetical protein
MTFLVCVCHSINTIPHPPIYLPFVFFLRFGHVAKEQMSFNRGAVLDRWGRDRISGGLCAHGAKGFSLSWWGCCGALVGLGVMIWVPAGVNFPLGCPEVSHGDPRAQGSNIVLPEGHFSTICRRVVEAFQESFEAFRLFLLGLGVYEAHVWLRIDYLALGSAKVFGKRGVSGVRSLVGCEVGLLQGA